MADLTRVDFFSLAATDRRARLVCACQVAAEVYDQGHRVFVRTQGPAETAEFDQLLWTYAEGSFVPHGVWPMEPEVAAATPVLVGSSLPPASHRDVLINLAADAPAEVSAYARICEIVGGDEQAILAGRARWRAYREQGLAPGHQAVQGKLP